MIKVYGYIRKSPDEKEKTMVSLENQKNLIIKTCKEKDWDLVEVFSDKDITGSDRYRKGFIEMMSKIFNNNVEIIVVKDQDRFCRDSSFFKDTLQDLDVRNKRVYSIMKNGFLSHEDLGDNVKALMDSQYITDQRKKADVNLKQKFENNLPSIPAPYGYKYNKDKKWIIDKRKADIVNGVLNDLINKVSFKDILKKYKINKSLYYRIIKNAKKGLYNGWITYERKHKDSNKKVVRIEEIRYKGEHKPIISQELFKNL